MITLELSLTNSLWTNAPVILLTDLIRYLSSQAHMSSSPALKELREIYNPDGSLNKLVVKVRDGNDQIHVLSLLETSHIEEPLVKFLKDELQHHPLRYLQRRC